MLKIYHVQGWNNYSNWVPDRQVVQRMEDADVVWFEGGEDVCPTMYNEKIGSHVHYNRQRDAYEKGIFEKAVALKKKIFGTCRGSQLICALSGGKVIQHQINPAYIHDMFTSAGKIIKTTSTHHNAMNPYTLPEKDYKILAWTEDICHFHLNGNDRESYRNGEKEVEVCYFRNTNALGFQGHPEMIYGEAKYEATIEYCRDILNKLVKGEL